ncbi:hypothetical protein EV715DRAFT_268727, partial [Schizophyllum commune]
ALSLLTLLLNLLTKRCTSTLAFYPSFGTSDALLGVADTAAASFGFVVLRGAIDPVNQNPSALKHKRAANYSSFALTTWSTTGIGLSYHTPLSSTLYVVIRRGEGVLAASP